MKKIQKSPASKKKSASLGDLGGWGKAVFHVKDNNGHKKKNKPSKKKKPW